MLKKNVTKVIEQSQKNNKYYSQLESIIINFDCLQYSSKILAIKLIVTLSKWDTNNIINKNMYIISNILINNKISIVQTFIRAMSNFDFEYVDGEKLYKVCNDILLERFTIKQQEQIKKQINKLLFAIESQQERNNDTAV